MRNKGADRKQWNLAAEEERAATSRAFSAYGHTLDMVPYFKYLGRGIYVADDDCPEVTRNMTKARSVWRRMAEILSREGARPRVSGFFFKENAQSVLLFGTEMWVVTPRMGPLLGGL